MVRPSFAAQGPDRRSQVLPTQSTGTLFCTVLSIGLKAFFRLFWHAACVTNSHQDVPDQRYSSWPFKNGNGVTAAPIAPCYLAVLVHSKVKELTEHDSTATGTREGAMG